MAKDIEPKLEKTIQDISNEEISIPRRGPGWRIVRRISQSAMVPRNNMGIIVNECSGCGTCAAICPMGNISIVNGRAAMGPECISCVACYHRCPENAIEYKGATGQYRGLVDTKELKSI